MFTRPVIRSRFLPTPADSVLSRLTLVKPPKNVQAIASQKTDQPATDIPLKLNFRKAVPVIVELMRRVIQVAYINSQTVSSIIH